MSISFHRIFIVKKYNLINKVVYQSTFKIGPGLFFIAIFLGLILVQNSFASEWSATAKINFRNQYDSNRSLTTADHESTSTSSLIPTVNFLRQTDVSTNNIIARVQASRFSDDTIQDANTQRLDYRFKYKGLRSSIKIKGKYTQDTTLSALNDFELGIDDIDDTGGNDEGVTGLNKIEVKRRKLRIDPQWIYSLSESYKVNINYSYKSRFYSQNTANLIEFDQNIVGLSLVKKFDERDSISYGVSRSYFNPEDNDENTENSAISFGYLRRISALSEFSLIIGARRTDTPTESTDGSIYRFRYKNKGEVSKLFIEVKRELSGSGIGSLVEDNILDIKYLLRLTPLTSFKLRVRAIDRRSLGDDNSASKFKFSIEPKFKFILSENFITEISYRYRQEDFDSTNNTADSSAVFLGIIYSFNKISTRL